MLPSRCQESVAIGMFFTNSLLQTCYVASDLPLPAEMSDKFQGVLYAIFNTQTAKCCILQHARGFCCISFLPAFLSICKFAYVSSTYLGKTLSKGIEKARKERQTERKKQTKVRTKVRGTAFTPFLFSLYRLPGLRFRGFIQILIKNPNLIECVSKSGNLWPYECLIHIQKDSFF